jgi:signal transduction histidine kinase
VPLSDRLIRLASGPHLPRRTLRLRLTLLYGGLFLVCGAALLAITYLLVAHAAVRPGYVRTVRGRGVALRASARGYRGLSATLGSAAGREVLTSVVRGQRISDLHQLVIWSGIALAIMAIISAWLGWIVAGRALRPLRTITTTAREISATNLHRRLALAGPDDELKDLGDTIDALLARLEGSFQAQRTFVANASHELRTPLALSRAMLQFALADPQLTLDGLKATCQDVLEAGADHEQLLEALLTLSRSQQELEQHESVDLAATVKDVIETHRQHAGSQGIRIHTTLRPATISGDDHLLRRLVNNLLENAIHYNVPGGEVRVAVEARTGDVTLTLANTGPRVPAEQIERLLQPFRRLAPDRAANSNGHGLGLSIVAAIAAAHEATLEIDPQAGGGLRVAIAFPRLPRTGPDAAADVSPPASDSDASVLSGIAR